MCARARQKFYIYSVPLAVRTTRREKARFLSCGQCVCGSKFVSRDKQREHSGKLSSVVIINSWRGETFNCDNYDNYWRA